MTLMRSAGRGPRPKDRTGLHGSVLHPNHGPSAGWANSRISSSADFYSQSPSFGNGPLFDREAPIFATVLLFVEIETYSSCRTKAYLSHPFRIPEIIQIINYTAPH